MKLDKMLELANAAKAGKTIQFNINPNFGKWEDRDFEKLMFSLPNECYRVKPEAYSTWTALFKTSKGEFYHSGNNFSSKEKAIAFYGTSHWFVRAVKLVEALDE